EGGLTVDLALAAPDQLEVGDRPTQLEDLPPRVGREIFLAAHLARDDDVGRRRRIVRLPDEDEDRAARPGRRSLERERTEILFGLHRLIRTSRDGASDDGGVSAVDGRGERWR